MAFLATDLTWLGFGAVRNGVAWFVAVDTRTARTMHPFGPNSAAVTARFFVERHDEKYLLNKILLNKVGEADVEGASKQECNLVDQK